MTRNIIFCLALVGVIVMPGLNSCQTSKAVGTKQNSAGISWEGVYTGTIPSASGMGIDVRITLNSDKTFELQYQYVGKEDAAYIHDGTFTLNEAGGLITLDTENYPRYYRLGENTLTHLDMEGNLITGYLADHYVLKKQR